jgi:hypothetical protein
LVSDDVSATNGDVSSFRISGYVKDKLDGLWHKEHETSEADGFFGDVLAQIAYQHPEHRLLFCGISHGAALAQAAALRFALMEPALQPRIHVASWNAYKWTDADGSFLAARILSDRLLPLVLSSSGNGRRWDSVPEFPPGLSPMPGTMLLDVDSGHFFSDIELGEANLGLTFATRLFELHFAKRALCAMKTATLRERTGRGEAARRHWFVARDILSLLRIRRSDSGILTVPMRRISLIDLILSVRSDLADNISEPRSVESTPHMLLLDGDHITEDKHRGESCEENRSPPDNENSSASGGLELSLSE